MVIDGKRVCFYIDETMYQKHGDDSLHYYPAIVTESEAGYSRTDWDYGTDFKLASEAVDSLNRKRGISAEEVDEIVMSSFRAHNVQKRGGVIVENVTCSIKKGHRPLGMAR